MIYTISIMSAESFRTKKQIHEDGLPYADIVPSSARNEAKQKRPEKRLYRLETGESIEVTAKEFEYHPTGGVASTEEGTERNVIFLPGWAIPSDSPAVTKLGQAFAEQSKGRAFAVTTRAEELPGTENPLYKEALAISKFIKEKGLRNVVLAGHSQGGDKAIDLATILQQDPEINISGLVLLDSMGLYEQDSLASDFAKDNFVNTPVMMAKNVIKNPGAVMQSLHAGNSVVKGIFTELGRSGTDFMRRTKDEIEVMSRKSSRMSQVQVPVILMSGSDDIISHPDKIIPPGEEERIVEEWEKRDAEAGTKTYIDPREKFLQEEMFLQSPYVRMLAPEKLGHHGLPLFRSESVANASLYLLRRFERREKVAVDEPKNEDA